MTKNNIKDFLKRKDKHLAQETNRRKEGKVNVSLDGCIRIDYAIDKFVSNKINGIKND